MSVRFEGEAAIRDAPTWRGHFNATANLVIASTLTREHADVSTPYSAINFPTICTEMFHLELLVTTG